MSRPESGSMQFGDDWPGVFIRGDNALWMVQTLDVVLRNNDYLPAFRVQLQHMRTLLAECRDSPGQEVTLLKPFFECLKDDE